jgi:alkanesulfonate monooxygenase SsuD/methylene tetrahydromethanopterin reductase-like flavin-dependent oxidoreductase (luciferase family)
MRLSVLDQAPIRKGGTAEQAIAETIELARHADRLGYHRYWLAEHHNSSSLACASPEILVAAIADRTRHIRVGTGGVMLPHYSALKVAETFRMLEALHPGRIDLGLGRAPGSDPLTARALASPGRGDYHARRSDLFGGEDGAGHVGIEQYPEQVLDLLGYLEGRMPDGHPFRAVHAMPAGSSIPELWLLGSGPDSAQIAAYFGLPFSFAQFITQRGGAEIVRAYRAGFRPSRWLAEPQASIGVSLVVADTEEEAQRHALSRYLWWIKIMKGQAEGFPPPEEALAYSYQPSERELLEKMERRSIAGTPATVRQRLLEMAAEYEVDEIVVLTITYDFAARVRSYELLAEAFELPTRDVSPTETALPGRA